jgi:hypothetical protein
MPYFPLTYKSRSFEGYRLQEWSNEPAPFPEMKFSINIPQNFELVNGNVQTLSLDKPIGDCAYFKSPDKDIEVLVQYAFLQFEVSLTDFLHYYSKSDDIAILEQRLIDNNSDLPDELIQVKFPDGQIWDTRRTGYKIWNGDGAFVIIINAACSQLNYNKYADLLFAITSSLRPFKKPDYEKAEKLKIVSRRYPMDFTTYLPFSWNDIHHHQDTMSTMNLVYTKKLHGELSGIFSISCLAIDPVLKDKESVFDKMHKPYKELGTDFSTFQLVKSDEIKCFRTLWKGTLDFHRKNDRPGNKSNITFYLAKKSGVWFYMEIFGPAQETDFEAWAINNRAMEIGARNMVTL